MPVHYIVCVSVCAALGRGFWIGVGVGVDLF